MEGIDLSRMTEAQRSVLSRLNSRKGLPVSEIPRGPYHVNPLADYTKPAVPISVKVSDGTATDKKTDKPKKLPPHDVNDCARYIVEQQKNITKRKRPSATKKALIAEHLGHDDTTAMERQLQPSRFGWLLNVANTPDK